MELAAEERALFSLGLAAPLARLETRLRGLARLRVLDTKGVLVIAYLDDLLLSLPPELVQEGLILAQEELGTVGLTLNEAKTNAWAPQPPPPEVLTLLQVDDCWKTGRGMLAGDHRALLSKLALEARHRLPVDLVESVRTKLVDVHPAFTKAQVHVEAIFNP